MTPPVDTTNKLQQPNRIQEEQILMESQDKQCTYYMYTQGFLYHR